MGMTSRLNHFISAGNCSAFVAMSFPHVLGGNPAHGQHNSPMVIWMPDTPCPRNARGRAWRKHSGMTAE